MTELRLTLDALNVCKLDRKDLVFISRLSHLEVKHIYDISSSCSFLNMYFNLALFRFLHQSDEDPGYIMHGWCIYG